MKVEYHKEDEMPYFYQVRRLNLGEWAEPENGEVLIHTAKLTQIEFDTYVKQASVANCYLEDIDAYLIENFGFSKTEYMISELP
ncbi:hypothetical protein NV379_01865 [Paenibacillus sp. N1-5-1-14]|uniref:hypothetical protein n=1 Tax=Paenibacillus radicibacter TaxID=2972488 RepID=UPI002158CA17|nr:hypothetical protein [Paenibacillus radicibacter]MCR8641391.1 hypothetical protein [Paenibacillus radicibacter]